MHECGELLLVKLVNTNARAGRQANIQFVSDVFKFLNVSDSSEFYWIAYKSKGAYVRVRVCVQISPNDDDDGDEGERAHDVYSSNRYIEQFICAFLCYGWNGIRRISFDWARLAL